jgi:RNA polymerase sigma-70 factor (ECF subfamily)
MKNDENITKRQLKNDNKEQKIASEDHDLINRVLYESTEAYRLLVAKYQIPVYNLLLRMVHDRDDAKELTQEVFVKAYEALPSFRFEYRFFSWLYRIAINLALSHIKKQRQFVGLEKIKDVAEEIIDNDTDKEKHVKMAVEKLKEKYRTVIVLKYYQQLSYKEVASVLDISEKKVRSRLYDARLQIKEMLETTEYYSKQQA